MDTIRSIKNYIEKYVYKEPIFTFNLDTYRYMMIFGRYIFNNHHIITTDYDYVNQQYLTLNVYNTLSTDICTTKLDTVIEFNDTELKLKGYFVWKLYDLDVSSHGMFVRNMVYSGMQCIYPTVTITECGNNKIINVWTYIRELLTINLVNQVPIIHLDGINEMCYYEKSYKQSTDTLHSMYMDTYFSSSKDIIMNKINNSIETDT